TIQDLIEKLAPENNMTADEYITVDSTLKTDGMLDDEDIIALVRGDENEENDDDECQVVDSRVTTKEAIDSIDKLISFFNKCRREI
ncbi:781_t:CDS:1, partial [Paraglomus occultum]